MLFCIRSYSVLLARPSRTQFKLLFLTCTEGVDLRADLSEDELLQKILAGTLEFKPGEQ